jgi:hypothetical protein
MQQADWVGAPTAAVKPFKDIRNTRESVAEEKARLVMELGWLFRSPPPSVVNGSIQKVRQWTAAREAARKVAASARSSAHDLRSAITSMQGFEA